MSSILRVALAQVNPTVGDLRGNVTRIIGAIGEAREAGADLMIFPELAISGYPPEDLLTRPAFIHKVSESADTIAREVSGVTVIVGAPVGVNGRVMNSALVMSEGVVKGRIYKTELPNYGVFDERRYFSQGANGPLVKVDGALVGVTICEDIWVRNTLTESLVADGANFLVNLSGSPYRQSVLETRHGIVSGITGKLSVPFAYCNLVGGQDELVFDGRSFVMNLKGNIISQAEAFREDILIVDVDLPPSSLEAGREVMETASRSVKRPEITQPVRREIKDEDEEVYEALTMGVRDYVNKNGFKDVVIALSGGVDSALTCAIAVDALGPERTHVVSLPSPYSSQGSIDDAKKLADNLGLELISIPIHEPMAAYENALKNVFKGMAKDVTEENLQARIRGALAMALSNKFGWLVLTTGNKSEIAVGYCTLYGDMVGGFAVIKDLFKTKVYSLCQWRNRKAGYDLIPENILNKAPSAELRPDQKDTDSLPPYDLLDPILEAYIEREKNIDEIVDLGYSRPLVSRVIRMVDASEYKRRQGPIGVKITTKAFGRDRRHPITCRYRDE